MRICINTLALSTTKAGMGNYMYHLVHGVTALDALNEYYILVSHANERWFRITKKNVHLLNLGRTGIGNTSRFFFEQFSVHTLLKKYAIDLYHNPGFTLPLKKTTKQIVTIADMTYFSHPQYHLWWKVPYFQWMIPHAVKQAEAVIAISESTRQDILRYIPCSQNKTTAIYLGVDSCYKALNKAYCKKRLQTKYGIEKPFVLYIGMLEPRKNIVGLLRAFTRLIEMIPPKSHILVIVGKKGWMYDAIFTTVRKLALENYVLFTNYVPDEDLPYFYNAATAFVYPSFYEGFGLPILESMACGCPVITSATSSMKEIAGNAALLIDPENNDEMTASLAHLLKNDALQKRLSQKGLQRSKKFSWENMCKKTIALYQEVYHGTEA